MGDSFGKLFKVSTWGESHGSALGVLIEGCPPLVSLDLKEENLSIGKLSVPVFTCREIQKDLDRRRPGQSRLTTPRQEQDQAYILSGLFEGKTTGTPIQILTWNNDSRSQDYQTFKTVDRPSHAGFTYREKYGIYDYRGGGRSSYRETWGRVAAGSLAKKILKEQFGITILAWVDQIGSVCSHIDPSQITFDQIESHPTRCPNPDDAKKMETLILQTMKQGDSLGGAISLNVQGAPIGWGEPVFDKLDADLFKALKSIHATKSVQIGLGEQVAQMKGSNHNDVFEVGGLGQIHPKTNRAGGVLGGISTGEDIFLRVTFKPTATIGKPQDTVSISGEKTVLKGVGRHDPCVLPRAVPTVEAMTALTLLDHALRHHAQCSKHGTG